MSPAESALSRYRTIAVEGELTDASPHRVIQMLLTGAVRHITLARRCAEGAAIAEKGEHIGRAIDIVGELRASLDLKQGEIALQLDAIYLHVIETLLVGHAAQEPTPLDDALGVLSEIKQGWDAIAPSLATTDAAAAG